MSKENNTGNFDELSHLLKKIEWPQPDQGLAYRIQCAAVGDTHTQNEIGFFQFKSPVLASIAVMVALILGVTSGMTTNGTASADGYESHAYNSSSLTLTQIYAGGSHE